MRILRGALAAMTILVAAGQGARGDADADFARFVDGYFAARFDFRPSEGTAAGLHEYDNRLEDLSRGRIERRVAEVKDQQAELAKLDPKALSFDNAIDAAILDGRLKAEVLDLETLPAWRDNPMTYAGMAGESLDLIMKRDFAPIAARAESVVGRLGGVPALVESAKANLGRPPKEFTDLAIRMAKGSLGFVRDAVPAWAKPATDADPALEARLDAASAKAAAALEGFVAWLESDLKPRSDGKYAIGAEHYLNKLKYEEMIELPLDELLARGEAQLAKDYAAFVATARQIDPSKTPAEVMVALSEDHPTADDLVPSVRRSVEAAREYLVAKQIVTIPSEVRPKIEETPAYARSGGFASMDTPGPFESKATEAFYYVTPVEPDWTAEHKEEHLRLFNGPVVAMINVHEAYPGHYLQFLYAPRFPTKVRKLTYCGSNVEGWAHYTEQMMVDEGFGGDDPKVRLAQLQEALLRDCRYVVGIKLHTAGWTVEEGAKLFVDKGFQEPANAYEESRRGAYNPTYLYYTFGKIEIQKLRDEYRDARGGTLRDFHDAFVAQGGLPLPLLRRVLLR